MTTQESSGMCAGDSLIMIGDLWVDELFHAQRGGVCRAYGNEFA